MHPTDIEDLKILTDILHHSGTNPTERKQIEDEQEAWRTINALFEEKEKEFLKKLEEQNKALDETKRENAALLAQLEALKRKLNE